MNDLVCVPGLGLEAAAWRAADELGAVVWELPGFGTRPRPDDDLRPAALGARLAAGLRGPSVLLGHSAGSQVVTHAAAAAPDRVRGLVLVGPTTDPRAATWPRLAGRWMRTAVREPPWQVPLLLRGYSRVGLRWMAATMDAARRDDVRIPLAGVECPVLVVRGPRDRICPEDWARELARAGRAGSLAVTLPQGAHMVPLTHPRAVGAAVTSWLDVVTAPQ